MENIVDKSKQWTVNMRPRTFGDVYGLDKIKKYFYKCSIDRSYPTAMLFNGMYGCGKTTSASIVAAMISCEHPVEVKDDKGKVIGYDPCGTCPACKAILEEKFNRECMQIDGGQASKSDIIETITNFVATPPFKDRAKIVIVEELQELSTSAKNSLLKLIETRRPNIHYIFTSMESLKGSGLVSRCVNFKFPYTKVEDTMYFLKQTLERAGLWSSDKIPMSFKTEGLQMIAINSEGSLRTAMQILQQALKMEAYSIQEIQEFCGLENIGGFYDTLLRVLNGENSEELFDEIINTQDYPGTFALSMKVISDAESFRIFGDVPGSAEFFKRQAAQLCSHPNFPILREGLKKLQEENNSYMKKSVYVIGMCDIIEKCRNATAAPTSRRIVS